VDKVFVTLRYRVLSVLWLCVCEGTRVLYNDSTKSFKSHKWIDSCYEQPLEKMLYKNHKCADDFQHSKMTNFHHLGCVDVECGWWKRSYTKSNQVSEIGFLRHIDGVRLLEMDSRWNTEKIKPIITEIRRQKV